MHPDWTDIDSWSDLADAMIPTWSRRKTWILVVALVIVFAWCLSSALGYQMPEALKTALMLILEGAALYLYFGEGWLWNSIGEPILLGLAMLSLIPIFIWGAGRKLSRVSLQDGTGAATYELLKSLTKIIVAAIIGGILLIPLSILVIYLLHAPNTLLADSFFYLAIAGLATVAISMICSLISGAAWKQSEIDDVAYIQGAGEGGGQPSSLETGEHHSAPKKSLALLLRPTAIAAILLMAALALLWLMV